MRPHHLLCTMAYIGKGYNKEFIENMNRKIKYLKTEDAKIRLKIKVDSICESCPNKKEEKCITENKVKIMDEKVLSYFNLEEKEYFYKEIIEDIKRIITKEVFDDICKDCEWYNMGVCKELIIK
ncbi:MAG: DUF1284 domain-containing protein [Clostridium sp.]|uniref:DUF1284 domain-containing protein n=1 Tax=Clostridium sp. TaxID=1506 RepID=UPI003EE7D0A9